MSVGSLVMQQPSPAVAGLGMGNGQGMGCMGTPRPPPPGVGTSAGTRHAEPTGVWDPRDNWLLNMKPVRFAEITRQHTLMHEPEAKQGSTVKREMERRRQSQRLLNVLAQRNLQGNGQRAQRSGVLPDDTKPSKHQYWDICCILDVLEGSAWAGQPLWHFLLLWKAGDTTWEECTMLQRSIGLPAILEHLSDVERMRSHHTHDSRSMMGYDHPWMPKNLRNDEHNFGHDPLWYFRQERS
jgi:hypothetical protein